jgi:PAS domain S-box-containing protein
VSEGLLRMPPSSLQSVIEDHSEAEAARKIDLLFTLAAVAETTASLVLITDADDRIEWVNPSFTRVTGWTLDEVEGLTPREVLNRGDSEQSPEWEAARSQRLRGEPVGNIEIKLYRKNGQPYWALVEVRPMPDESGAVRRYLHLQTDTTERVLAERRAKETYRWLQLAGSVLGLGLWHTSLPDGVMLWDANLKSIFGLPPDAPTPSFEELLDRYVLPEDQLLVRRSTRDIPEAGAHTEAEFRIRRADGAICTVVSRQACIEHEEDGQPRRMLGAVLDVTEARNTTLRLRDALRRLRLAAEASGIGAWERDLVTDEGTWDPTMFTLQGLLPADCAPSSAEVLQMVHPDDRSVVERAWQRMIEELRPVEYEYRIVKPDGGIVHMVTRGVVERDTDGTPWRAIGTAIDVTYLRRAEHERDELARRIELVADAVGLGIWELEPQLMRVRWNDRMYALYGHTRETFIPRRWAEVVHPEDRARAQQALERASTVGGPFDIEFRVMLPDGRTCWLASRGRGELAADGTVARVVGVNWDITERVQMEQSALAAERTARDLLDRVLLATSATGLGVWEHVVANGQLIWDPQMYQLFGRQPADGAPHEIWPQAVHPDDLAGVNAAVTESMNSGRRFEAEFRVCCCRTAACAGSPGAACCAMARRAARCSASTGTSPKGGWPRPRCAPRTRPSAPARRRANSCRA